MIDKKNTPAESIESVRALKRRIYFAVLVAGLLAISIDWIPNALDGTLTSYERVIFPISTAVCLGLLIALWRARVSLVWIEWSLFAAITLGLLVSLFVVLFKAENALDPNHLGGFSDLLYWFPLVYVLAFFIFDSHRGLLVGSLVFFAASLILGLTDSILDWRSTGDMEQLYLLGRFYLANAAYIVLLMVGVRLNEQHVRVRMLAETMTHLAHTDTLIQIANRRELDETITREISRASRHSQPLAMIMFDLDNFKEVNDAYGHDAGDTVLKETARIVRGLVRSPDLLGRWGGEEFLVIAPQTGLAQARGLAERLRHALAYPPLEHVGSTTASFGVAEFRPPESPEDWLKRADEALYTAKQGGRNQVALAT